MEELSRRELVKVLVRSTASGFLVGSLAACSRDSLLFEPDMDHGDPVLSFRDCVGPLTALCEDELRGFRLGQGLHPDTWAPEPGPGFESLNIADGFTFVGDGRREGSVVVNLRYSLVGEFDGLRLSRKATSVTYPYYLRYSAGSIQITYSHPITVTKNTAKTLFTELHRSHLASKHQITDQDNSLAVKNLRRLINKPGIEPKPKANLKRRLARVESGYYHRRDFNEKRYSLAAALKVAEAL